MQAEMAYEEIEEKPLPNWYHDRGVTVGGQLKDCQPRGIVSSSIVRRRRSHIFTSSILEHYVAIRRKHNINRVVFMRGAAAAAEARHKIIEKPLAQRFQEEADKWYRETAHLSSPTQKAGHPSYQAILGMGTVESDRREVIRLLLSDLQRNRRPWFWALSFLTRENPISRDDAGKLDKMLRAWTQWGEREGLL